MRNFLKSIPIPMGGLILALAALGNLLSARNPMFKYALGILSFVLFALLLMKFIFHGSIALGELDNPVILSVFPTISMSIILYSTYVVQYSKTFAHLLWFLGLFMHISLVVIYSWKYLLNFDASKIFPSVFIIYVGFVTASVASKPLGFTQYGKVLFSIGFLSYVVILSVVLFSLFKAKNRNKKTLPLFVIMAAPSNLCLAGYLFSFQTPEAFMVIVLYTLCAATNIYAYIKLIQSLSLDFSPAFSAFTFPLVIGAIAGNKLTVFYAWNILKYISLFQELIAVTIVTFVLYKYIKFLFKSYTHALSNSSVSQ